MAIKFTFFLTILLSYASSGDAYKILGIIPFCARSHHNSLSSILRGLADAGHDVTIISCYKDKHIPQSTNGSYKEVTLTRMLRIQEEEMKEIDMFEYDQMGPLIQVIFMMEIMNELTKQFLDDPNIQHLLHSNQSFDATIYDEVLNGAVKGLSVHFNAHQIIINSLPVNAWVNEFVGNPSLPSHTSDFVLGYLDRMRFWQRLTNTLYWTYFKFYKHFVFYPQQKKLMKKYFPNAPDFYEVLYNVSFLFYAGHTSVTAPQNVVPNMLGVAGMQIKGPKELSKDLKEYLDNSKNGVVYFSLGSVANSTNMPLGKRNMILRVLGKLKQNVLWKWEDDNLPGKARNIRTEKWLSQESILAHPNVKLFITHGGYLSTLEAVYYAVPIVIIPVFADQKINAQKSENDGYGRMIPFQKLTEEGLSVLIDEVLHNPKYKENVRHRSVILRDRQTTPLQDTVYWVEYIIRHNGAKHLRVKSMDLAWYQFYLLDVFGFVIAVLILIFFVIRHIIFYYFSCSEKLVKNQKLS